MGTQLGPILEAKEIKIQDLTGKKVVVDSFNILYQFLSTIRQQDGSLLTDSHGNITSHLSGLFFRTTNLMKNGIRLAFVFDGIAPDLKKKERERRKEAKETAKIKYDQAAADGDIELMKKYASRTSTLTSLQIQEAKELISALGLPIIQAPSEGEAQAAHMVRKQEFYGLVSQDTDGLLFGAPKLIKNLSITGRKKRTGKSSFQVVEPEVIDLVDNLNHLSIDREQLIVVGMLCGTDFNIGGIKGIGPKKAHDLVKKYGKDFDRLFLEAKWDETFTYTWKEVFDTIYKMPVVDDYNLNWGDIDNNKIYELLVEKHDFSKERVEKVLEELNIKTAQKGLGDFF
ncbi:MAG: flap endonuclease-1 [archaeon]